MTEAQADKALAMLSRKQLHGSVVQYGTRFYAVECPLACFTSIRAFQGWLKAQPTWREKLDTLAAQLDQLAVSQENMLAGS